MKIDGGFGWVVVAASFCCCFIVDGIVMSAGAFLGEIEKEFKAGKTEVSTIKSMVIAQTIQLINFHLILIRLHS